MGSRPSNTRYFNNRVVNHINDILENQIYQSNFLLNNIFSRIYHPKITVLIPESFTSKDIKNFKPTKTIQYNYKIVLQLQYTNNILHFKHPILEFLDLDYTDSSELKRILCNTYNYNYRFNMNYNITLNVNEFKPLFVLIFYPHLLKLYINAIKNNIYSKAYLYYTYGFTNLNHILKYTHIFNLTPIHLAILCNCSKSLNILMYETDLLDYTNSQNLQNLQSETLETLSRYYVYKISNNSKITDFKLSESLLYNIINKLKDRISDLQKIDSYSIDSICKSIIKSYI
jgi:hypothetical protein